LVLQSSFDSLLPGCLGSLDSLESPLELSLEPGRAGEVLQLSEPLATRDWMVLEGPITKREKQEKEKLTTLIGAINEVNTDCPVVEDGSVQGDGDLELLDGLELNITKALVAAIGIPGDLDADDLETLK